MHAPRVCQAGNSPALPRFNLPPYVTCQGCSILCFPVGRGEATILFQSVKPDPRCFTLTDRMLIAQSPGSTAITIWSIANTVVLIILSKQCPVYCSVMCTTLCGQTVRMFDKPVYRRASQNKGLVTWVNPSCKFWEMLNFKYYVLTHAWPLFPLCHDLHWTIMPFCLLHEEIQRISGRWKFA